jgi:micrococcal nuclease
LAAQELDATLVGVRVLALTALLIFPLACGGTHDVKTGIVAHVRDGDTIMLSDGRRVRLVQLDAPEMDEGECYAREATRLLERLLPRGTKIELETDPALDKRDEFDRVLAYVEKEDTNINLELVRAGAAAPWFFEGARGRHASTFHRAANEARRNGRGLWGACPGTALDPLHSVEAAD